MQASSTSPCANIHVASDVPTAREAYQAQVALPGGYDWNSIIGSMKFGYRPVLTIDETIVAQWEKLSYATISRPRTRSIRTTAATASQMTGSDASVPRVSSRSRMIPHASEATPAANRAMPAGTRRFRIPATNRMDT